MQSGRQVTEYDLLLLEFVFGQRPDDAAKVKAHLLESIAADPELQKAEILFLGSYGRACEFLAAGDTEVRAVTFAVSESLFLGSCGRACEFLAAGEQRWGRC